MPDRSRPQDPGQQGELTGSGRRGRLTGAGRRGRLEPQVAKDAAGLLVGVRHDLFHLGVDQLRGVLAIQTALGWHRHVEKAIAAPRFEVDDPDAIAAWQRLPVAVTRVVGPRIVKYLP